MLNCHTGVLQASVSCATQSGERLSLVSGKTRIAYNRGNATFLCHVFTAVTMIKRKRVAFENKQLQKLKLHLNLKMEKHDVIQILLMSYTGFSFPDKKYKIFIQNRTSNLKEDFSQLFFLFNRQCLCGLLPTC